MTDIRHQHHQPDRVIGGPLAPQFTRRDTPTAAARDLGPCIYAAQVGRAIKIGYTTNLDRRIRSYGLSWSDVLVAIPASLDLEQRLHRQFAEHRQRGKFYDPAPELLGWINTERTRLGAQPVTLTTQTQRPRA